MELNLIAERIERLPAENVDAALLEAADTIRTLKIALDSKPD